MNSPILRRLATILLAFLLLFYIGYQVYNANYTSVKTETATYASSDDPGASEIIQATCTAVRKESVIQQQVNGVVTYVVKDGGKVAKNGTVAEVYATSQDAASEQRVEELTLQIEQLQKFSSPGSTYAADQDSLTKQISQKLISLLQKSAGGEYSALQTPREDLLYLLNERQIVTKKVDNFNERIASLTAQRDALSVSGQKLGSVASPASGIFVSKVDGYEQVFDYDSILTLTPEEYRQKQQQAVTPPADAVGKICHEFNWYLVCVVPAEDSLKFQEGNRITVGFPFATSQTVTATIRAVNQADQQSEAAVILECGEMNEELARLRTETCSLSVSQYSGIRVSQKAIHFQEVTKTYTDENGEEATVTKEVKGVYVMHGSEIRFRQIIPVFSTASYVICEQNPNDGELMTAETVQLYDEIVVEGTDLYDGKVVK